MTDHPDVIVRGRGSVLLFHLESAVAREWVEDFVSADRQFLGAALAVEHRYVGDLVAGMVEDGLVVEVLR